MIDEEQLKKKFGDYLIILKNDDQWIDDIV